MFSKVLLINKKVMVCKGMNQTGTRQAQQQGGQGQQQQGNQSSGPLEQLGEAIKAPFQ